VEAGAGFLTKNSGKWEVTHKTCSPSIPTHQPIAYDRRTEMHRWIADMVREEGGVDAAATLYAQLNEHWDGEQAIAQGAWAEFYLAVSDYYAFEAAKTRDEDERRYVRR
jgi:hypothetical protein